LFSTQH